MPDNQAVGAESPSPSLRIQSAMVLFALEEALGTFVVQAAPSPDALPTGILSEIERRIHGDGFLPVPQIVQETYIKEVIDLAVSASKDRSERDALERLRKLVEVLDVFEIRNAVCHPNRQFPECYWHRMAALGSDPCVDQLRLRKVTDALRCAIEGRLTPPPEGWLQQRPFSVPNNLPSTFDHHLTGLIARQDEARELRKRLQNPRNSLVAIVGAGGTGKTALCLEVLHSCVVDPTTLQWIDQIIYLTAKTEHLTQRGIEPISDPLVSLAMVRSAILEALYSNDVGEADNIESKSFDKAVAEMSSRRTLLCIDNLETLLREHAQEFDDFVQSLPHEWRILVTSRVTVNGANVLPLGPIRREGGVKLARDYTSLRGAVRLNEAQLGQLVDVCDRNPLAIRLVIDTYAAGTELNKALSQTKDRITEFSYTSLIEHLPLNAGKVLECLFGSNIALTRGEIGHLLGLVPDEVAEAMNGLLRTSLVTREVSGTSEKYALSSSVRNLLLKTPHDQAVRDDVYARLRDQERILLELERQGNKDVLSDMFVSLDAPGLVRTLIARVRASVLGRSSRAIQMNDLGQIRQALEFDASSPLLRRTEAILLQQLGDRYGAVESFEKAVSATPSDACSRLRLAEIYKDDQRLEEALELTTPLIEAGFLNNTDISARNRIRLFRAHWVTVLWLKRFDEVLKATEGWQRSTDLRPALVALRVSALQRYIDEGTTEMTKINSGVSEIITCSVEAFRLDGYLPDVIHETFHALERISRMFERGRLVQQTIQSCARFIDEHVPAMCATSYQYSLQDDLVVRLVDRLKEAWPNAANPLRGPRWGDLMSTGNVEDAALADVGYEQARLSNVNCAHLGYVFARALDGTRDFYVHEDATNFSSAEFRSLKQGQLVSVLPGESTPSSGRAWPAKHVMLV